MKETMPKKITKKHLLRTASEEEAINRSLDRFINQETDVNTMAAAPSLWCVLRVAKSQKMFLVGAEATQTYKVWREGDTARVEDLKLNNFSVARRSYHYDRKEFEEINNILRRAELAATAAAKKVTELPTKSVTSPVMEHYDTRLISLKPMNGSLCKPVAKASPMRSGTAGGTMSWANVASAAA